MFKHGEMDNVHYAHKVFKLHADRAFTSGLPDDFVALELGPGDSLLSGLIAKSYGASRVYLCDAGNYASKDVELYKEAAKVLRADYGLAPPDIQNIKTIDEYYKICGIEYVSNGLQGLKDIPGNSIDLIWSHSVVEHIRKKEFEDTMLQLSRIIKPEGLISHNVDLQDHLERKLNNLRFSDKFWENDFVANAGFYTNRLGYEAALKLMQDAGQVVLKAERGCWDRLPTPKSKMWQPFQEIPDDVLRVRTYSVLLRTASTL